jgi:arsenical pump membrane protein
MNVADNIRTVNGVTRRLDEISRGGSLHAQGAIRRSARFVSDHRQVIRTLPALSTATAAIVALRLAPGAALAAGARSWPPFALVAGLLLVGLVAARAGLFTSLGRTLAALPGGGLSLFLGLLALVAAVTVVLNLDTAAAFLTPVLIEAARARRLDPAPFLYGTVLMSNGASLLLPGSNLTNLLVVGETHLPGHRFAAEMLAPWAASVVVTALTVGLLHRRALRTRGEGRPRAEPPRAGAGLLGVLAAGLLVLLRPEPSLPVLGVGAAVAAWGAARGWVPPRAVLETLDPRSMGALFALTVVLGTVARSWSLPADMIATASPATSALAGAIGAVLLNNLPAAVLLSARPAGHPLALLLGLDLGPDLAVTGSLSALLWYRVARGTGCRPSVRRFSLLGVIVAPLCLAAALLAMSVAPPG